MVLRVEMWVVKTEQRERHRELRRWFLDFIKLNPKLLAEIRSLRRYAQTFGSPSGAIVEVVEFDSLADKEVLDRRLSKGPECLRFHEEPHPLKDESTITMSTWEPYL